MESYLSYEIALGKRQLLTPLDLERFFEQNEKVPIIKKTENQDHPQLPRPSFQDLPLEKTKRQRVSIPIEPFGSIESNPFVHARMRIIRDILREVCLTDNFNVKRYRTLDERQRSLMNKILGSMLEPGFLDLIDTYERKYISTSDFLRKSHSKRESTVLNLRINSLIRAKNPEPVVTEEAEGDSHMRSRQTQDCGVSLMLHTITGSDENRATSSHTASDLVLNMIQAIKATAITALTNGKPCEWLHRVLTLLKEIVKVPFSSIAELYCDKLDLRLSCFLYDKDNDVNRFFARLKSRIKSGVLKPPVTVLQLNHWDQTVVEYLNKLIDKIELHLTK
jgi:hypothetical protein